MDEIVGDCLKVLEITTITDAKKIGDYEYIHSFFFEKGILP